LAAILNSALDRTDLMNSTLETWADELNQVVR
jgi:hypothetical protein